MAATKHKLEKYGPFLDELHSEGVDYAPVVWTCWGRPGTAATSAVRSLACAAARRHGIADPAVLENRANAIIGCFIWKRAASMALACLGHRVRADVQQLLLPEHDSDSEGESQGFLPGPVAGAVTVDPHPGTEKSRGTALGGADGDGGTPT